MVVPACVLMEVDMPDCCSASFLRFLTTTRQFVSLSCFEAIKDAFQLAGIIRDRSVLCFEAVLLTYLVQLRLQLVL